MRCAAKRTRSTWNDVSLTGCTGIVSARNSTRVKIDAASGASNEIQRRDRLRLGRAAVTGPASVLVAAAIAAL